MTSRRMERAADAESNETRRAMEGRLTRSPADQQAALLPGPPCYQSARLMRPVAALYVAAAVLATAVGSYFAFRPSSAGGSAGVTFWLQAGGPTLALAAI